MPFNTCFGYKTIQSGPQDSFLLASQRFLLREFSISKKMENRRNTYWSFYQCLNKFWTMVGQNNSNPISINSLRPIFSTFMIFHILPLSATLTSFGTSVPPPYRSTEKPALGLNCRILGKDWTLKLLKMQFSNYTSKCN